MIERGFLKNGGYMFRERKSTTSTLTANAMGHEKGYNDTAPLTESHSG